MGSVVLLVLLVVVGLLAAFASTQGRRHDPDSARTRSTLRLIAAGTLIGAVVMGAFKCVVVIPPGSVGVSVAFGRVGATPLRGGLHVLAPWVDLELMSVRTQSYTMTGLSSEGQKTGDDSISVLTANGMEMKLDATVTYRLLPEAAPWVYRNLGEDYEDRLIRPSIRTSIRDAASKFNDEEVYGAKREQLAQAMESGLESSLQKSIRGDYADAPAKVFSVSNVMVRNLVLPPSVIEGINRKLVMRQESERMEFQIERDRKEAERKVIEAKGIQDSQAIIAKGITPDYLTWKSIEATEMLARSPNAKIIVIGNTRNGLPIMLDQSVPPSPGALTAEEREGHGRHGAVVGTNNMK